MSRTPANVSRLGISDGDDSTEVPSPTGLLTNMMPRSERRTSEEHAPERCTLSFLADDPFSMQFLREIEHETTRALSIERAVPVNVMEASSRTFHFSLSHRSGQAEIAACARSLCQHGIAQDQKRLQWLGMHILLYEALMFRSQSRTEHVALHINIGRLAEEVGNVVGRPGHCSREFMRAFSECIKAFTTRPDFGYSRHALFFCFFHFLKLSLPIAVRHLSTEATDFISSTFLSGINKQLTRSASMLASVTIRNNRPVFQRSLDIKKVCLHVKLHVFSF